MSAPTFIIGDIHGQCEKLVGLVQDAGLTDAGLAWTGGDARLYFLGDYVDRGMDGLGVLDFLIDLRAGAAAAGGWVEALLGNHDVMLLAAHRFGDEAPPGADFTFLDVWWRNGGQLRDLKGLTPERIIWLAQRPAMAMIGTNLLQHADSAFYQDYGLSVADVNASFTQVLFSDDFDAWVQLVVGFVRRFEFDDLNGGTRSAAVEHLRVYGARRLIHGHTPIPFVTRSHRGPVTAPRSYADGLCVNLDGGMFLGEPGFIYELPPEAEDVP